jgi:hypothetical protein
VQVVPVIAAGLTDVLARAKLFGSAVARVATKAVIMIEDRMLR